MNKTTQISLLLVVTIEAMARFLYAGGRPNIQVLTKSVAPAASLYPEAKSVSEKENVFNDGEIAKH